ncbi:phosphatase PAP2 family protein [uncultured Sphingomonas sp.]|uniref:phosphatase PAP2 family protein n=1 Tax=uncultured Sphingomonas sp. TaxID=158754 RepID=UPI0025FEE216|nr:phosphatase PAP2 family protein [uncultured Sphingomonas sp.]
MLDTRVPVSSKRLEPDSQARLGRYLSASSGIEFSGQAKLFCFALILIQLFLVWAVKFEMPWLISFDTASAKAFNRFGHAHPQFVGQTYWLTAALLIKTLPSLMLVVWCWFSSNDRPDTDRLQLRIAVGLAASFISIVVAMAVQELIGHRERPFFQPGYTFTQFFGGAPQRDISSFPSDTCALVFGLSTVVYLYSRRVGLFAFGWAVFAVALPRLVTGIHFVSDVVFSALNGIVLVILASAVLPALVKAPMSYILERYRALTYALTFGLLFEAGRMGGDLRPLVTGMLKAIVS